VWGLFVGLAVPYCSSVGNSCLFIDERRTMSHLLQAMLSRNLSPGLADPCGCRKSSESESSWELKKKQSPGSSSAAICTCQESLFRDPRFRRIALASFLFLDPDYIRTSIPLLHILFPLVLIPPFLLPINTVRTCLVSHSINSVKT
jgi:hypothetical protein